MTTEIKTVEALKEAMTATFHKHFPNGHCRITRGFWGSPALCLTVGLISDEADCPSKIRQNDPMHHSLWINEGLNGDEIVTDEISLECLHAALLQLSDAPIKLGYRKGTGAPAQLIKHLDTYFGKVAELVKENKDNIHGVTNIPSKYLL